MKTYKVEFKQKEEGWFWKCGADCGTAFTLFEAMNEVYVYMKEDLNRTDKLAW